jgi:hypothetical protein
MTFTYAVDGSTLSLLRFAIGDTDTANANKQIFTDEEIAQLSAAYGSDINTLAGHAMLAIASSAARIATVCRVGNQDFQIDRKQVAKECREQAAAFFKQAIETPYATEVHLNDEGLDYWDGVTGAAAYDFETEDDELNTP